MITCVLNLLFRRVKIAFLPLYSFRFFCKSWTNVSKSNGSDAVGARRGAALDAGHSGARGGADARVARAASGVARCGRVEPARGLPRYPRARGRGLAADGVEVEEL